MSYVALYRKYRPNTFESIVGQENITDILKNQIINGKVSHAYIFSGSRGTGKTSAAKVFARAVNCLNPKNGEPCNECSVCKGILNGSITDVIEMDAASNNGVENIRQIREEVSYATIDVKYRVYIIDEAHMLSTSAFNALLKTLEEPPENVIFILATTEQYKIPVTILSRCLKFEFNKLSKENIIKRLKQVLNSENILYDEEVLEYIAKASDGAMRDALSILERCLSENGKELKLEYIENILGSVNNDIVDNIVKAILDYNSIEAIKNIDEVIDSGRNLKELLLKITEKFLDILVSNNMNESSDYKNERLSYIIDELSRLDNLMKNSDSKDIILKANIVRLCRLVNNDNNGNVKVVETNNIDYQNTIEKLNNKVDTLEQNIALLKEKINNIDLNKMAKKSKNEKEVKSIDVSNFLKFDKKNDLEKYILEKGKITLYTMLLKSQMYIDNDIIYILVDNAYAYDNLRKDDNFNEIKQALKEKLDMNCNIKLELIEKSNVSENKIEKLLNDTNIEYTKLD